MIVYVATNWNLFCRNIKQSIIYNLYVCVQFCMKWNKMKLQPIVEMIRYEDVYVRHWSESLFNDFMEQKVGCS